MKREIKFRAWCYTGDKNEMVYFGNLECDNGLWFPCPSGVVHIDEYLSPPLQFTGLKAVSNNRDVYDGDVCTATFKTKDGIKNIQGDIVINEFMWCLETSDDTYSLNRLTIIDVIGNIYENPETLTP